MLNFAEACPSPSFNNFSLTFSFSPASNLNTGNVFNVELSDSSGDFTSPTLLTTSTATSTIVQVNFAMPTTVSGSNYKIRIKSTSPASTSSYSDAFAANYMIYNSFFTINNNVYQQVLCENSTYLLSVDESVNSPLQYPQLKYLWYKDGTLIPGETTSSLVVSSPGMYKTKIDYGSCTNDSNNIAYSNQVNLYSVSVGTFEITSESGALEFCESEWLTLTTTAVSPTNTYQWYLNDLPISGANSQSYSATQAGNYHLKIGTTICDLISNVLTISTVDTSSFTTNYDSNPIIEIMPGENITITANGADSYEWFVGNAVVETSNAYTTNQAENIQLTGTIGNCSVIKNFIVSLKEQEQPIPTDIQNIITPNNDKSNDTWDLKGFANNDDTEVVIFTASNKEVYRKKNYSDDWPLDGFVKNNTVYYYKILKNNSIVAKGTLSIVIK